MRQCCLNMQDQLNMQKSFNKILIKRDISARHVIIGFQPLETAFSKTLRKTIQMQGKFMTQCQLKFSNDSCVPLGYCSPICYWLLSSLLPGSGSHYRYFAIVHPLRYFGWKRALAPLSILVAVVYNVPKFFEFRYDFEERRITQTTLRSNPVYITYYIFWSKFILVEIIPYFTIIVLNSMIMGKIYKSTRFQNRFRYQSTIRGRHEQGGLVSLNPASSLSCLVLPFHTLHCLLNVLVNLLFLSKLIGASALLIFP